MALRDMFPVVAVPGARPDGWEPGWLALLLAVAVLSSVTFACVTPFSAFAVLVAATMKLRRALPVMLAIWLVNQLLGYLVLGYPLDAMSLAWGGAIGLAALIATVAAAAGFLLVRGAIVPRLAIAFAAAFIAYEVVLFLVSLGLGGSANFAPDIVAKLALSDAGWLVAVAILRHFLTWVGTGRAGWRHAVTT